MSTNIGPITEAMYYVLLALVKPGYGYRLMQAVSEVSDGRIQMGPGTLYGILSRMLKEELIALEEDDGRRKTYAITQSGKQVLIDEYERLKTAVGDGVRILGENGDV